MPAQPIVSTREREATAETMSRIAPPTFTDLAEERRHRKERLAAGFRVLAKLGLTTGIAGHITVRDPEHLDHFWVNPLSVPFSKMRVSDLLLVDRSGAVVEGDKMVNAAAFAIHSRIHHHNPGVVAACHSHSPWGRPWSATGRLIDPTSQDACSFYESQRIVEGFEGVVFDLGVGDRIGEAFAEQTPAASGVNTVIHENHGHITVGETVDEAVFWFLLFDQVCQSQMRLEATGRPYKVINHEMARHTNQQAGSAYAGWLGFQGYFTEITLEQPDLFD
ncbi:class II aldolase/adducin family protein [Prescottella equi]|uniref:class II aldolase/adducin family protein n=1 Tax=Rhodococcus hoagii TaxID=43767 RepID=UPI000D0E88D7|nr:class II aldolase/adducin family protein [Prescottella equi]AVP71413.1 class II aldolase/adducin family protein [Prescottella equi]MCD7052780.1 class II aldolase/adducin family protein [Rhodococcus sp. BH2-1]